MYVDPHGRQPPIEAGSFKPVTPSPHPQNMMSSPHHQQHMTSQHMTSSPHMIHPSQSTSALHMNNIGVSRSSSGSNLRQNHVYQEYMHPPRPDSGDPGGYVSRQTPQHHRDTADVYHRIDPASSGYSSRSASTKSTRSYRNNFVQQQQTASPNPQRRMLPDPNSNRMLPEHPGTNSSRMLPDPQLNNSPSVRRGDDVQQYRSNHHVPQQQRSRYYDDRVQHSNVPSHHGSMSSLHQPTPHHERNSRSNRSLDGNPPHGGRNSPKMGLQSVRGNSSRGPQPPPPQQQQGRIPGTSFSSSFH